MTDPKEENSAKRPSQMESEEDLQAYLEHCDDTIWSVGDKKKAKLKKHKQEEKPEES